MGANSKTAYRLCVNAGPDATPEQVLEIYRNEASLEAHFQTKQNNQSMIHQINTQYPSIREGEEEDIHKLHDKRSTVKIPGHQLQRKDTETTVAKHVTGVETGTSYENALHMVKNA